MFSLRIDDQTELRLIEARHAEELFMMTDQNRNYLRQWLPWVDGVTSVADTRNFIKGAMEQFAGNNGFQAGIWFDDRLVGMIGYHRIDWANRKTEIGYWLDAFSQGKGLVTRACGSLLNHAFHELVLNRVEIRCATENKRSQAIPERLGFQREGIIRQSEWLYDHFVDHIVYGMLAAQWRDVQEKNASKG